MRYLCKKCSEKKRIAGQAITKYICARCFRFCSHPNTSTPKICLECAKKNARCQRCCRRIHIKYNEEYDSYYNTDTDEWLEPGCYDKNCEFCNDRPAKPSECESKDLNSR